jgi:hypothetical protein
MIELDNGPVALSMVIAIAFAFPILYSFFVDRRNDKK